MLVAKNTLALFAGRVATQLFAFAFMVYVARYLGVDGFGKFNVVRTLFDMFASFAATSLAIIVTREVAQTQGAAGRIFGTTMALCAGLAATFGLVLIGLGALSGYAADTQQAILIAAIAVIPAALGELLQSYFTGFERAEYLTLTSIFENVLRIALSLAALVAGYGLSALFVVLVISRVAMVLLCLVILARLAGGLTWRFSLTELRSIVKEWRVVAVENWIANLSNSLDILLLSWFTDERMVGLYSVALRVLSITTTFASSFVSAMYPRLSKLYLSDRPRFVSVAITSARFMVLFILPVALVMGAASRQLIGFLFGDAFVDAAPIVPVLAIVLVLRFVNPFVSYVLFAQRRQDRSLQTGAAALVLYAVTGLVLVQFWQATGVAWAFAAASLFASGLYFGFAFDAAQRAPFINRMIRAALASALLIGGLVLLAGQIPFVGLLALTVTGYVVTVVAFGAISRDEVQQMFGAATNILNRFRGRRATQPATLNEATEA
jgi:O-antigen/teichoic acid export membrane protein